MGRKVHSITRTAERVSDLIDRFGRYCDEFDEANLFSGPSVYFHNKTIAQLRKHQSPSDALHDKEFHESLYATLTAWGLHRMGPGNTRLVDFEQMVASFQSQSSLIKQLEILQIWDLAPEQVEETKKTIWNLIASLQVGIGRTRIVSGSKALHHLLPELVPPIDREYTLTFFFNNKSLNQGGEAAFYEMYPNFNRIAVSCRGQIEARLGKGMNTSFTKVIDNAIVGYVIRHLKR